MTGVGLRSTSSIGSFVFASLRLFSALAGAMIERRGLPFVLVEDDDEEEEDDGSEDDDEDDEDKEEEEEEEEEEGRGDATLEISTKVRPNDVPLPPPACVFSSESLSGSYSV